MGRIAPDLLLFASVAGLHDSHQVCVFPLLLGLRPPTRRACDIDTVLRHDGETRKSDFRRLLRILLRFLRWARSSILVWWGHADGSVARVTEGCRRSRRWREHWRAETG